MTVLICTHNRAAQLAGALRSLEAQRLDKKMFEVLVVDNASTDNTAQVVRECAERGAVRVRTVKETEVALRAARNRGIRES